MMNNLIFIDSYTHSYKNYCKDINLIKMSVRGRVGGVP